MFLLPDYQKIISLSFEKSLIRARPERYSRTNNFGASNTGSEIYINHPLEYRGDDWPIDEKSGRKIKEQEGIISIKTIFQSYSTYLRI